LQGPFRGLCRGGVGGEPVALGLPEHERDGLPFFQREIAGDAGSAVRAAAVERGRGGQVEGEPLGAEGAAAGTEVQGVAGAGVVEGRAALQAKPGGPADRAHRAVDHAPLAGRDRHVVHDLPRPFLPEKAGDEDVGLGPVGLPRYRVPLPRAYLPEPAALAVEQTREHARRVEAGDAAPVDGAVEPDERGAVEVPDQPVVLYGEVASLAGRSGVRRGAHSR
jgi:hypothetical protein